MVLSYSSVRDTATGTPAAGVFRFPDLLGSSLVGSRNVLGALVFQVEYWWTHGFRPRMAGLTDEEFLWQPVPGCWTLHPTDDGLVLYDHEWPPPRPSPSPPSPGGSATSASGLANRASRLFPDTAPALLTTRMWEGPTEPRCLLRDLYRHQRRTGEHAGPRPTIAGSGTS